MKKIPLTQGKFALVDDEDFEMVSQYKWSAKESFPPGTWYAVRYRNKLMHHLILGESKITDHKDRNGLNNQRENLRFATASQNCANRTTCKHSSKFKGVCWNKQCKKWTAYISINKKRVHIGYFSDEIEAGKAYDLMAIKLFSEFALTNKNLGLL